MSDQAKLGLLFSEKCMNSFTSLGGSIYNGGRIYYDEILEFKLNSGTWILVDRMMSTRWYHAVSIISTEEIDIFC